MSAAYCVRTLNRCPPATVLPTESKIAASPTVTIATAALQMIPGVDLNLCRKPEILADAAYFILTSESKATTGNFFIDDELLAALERQEVLGAA